MPSTSPTRWPSRTTTPPWRPPGPPTPRAHASRHRFAGPSSATIALDRDDRRVLSAGIDYEHNRGFAHIRDLRDGSRIVIKATPAIVTSAAFSPDGRRVLTGGADKTVRISSAVDGKLLRTLGGSAGTRHAGIVWTATWSADGRRIVTAGNDRTVRIWNAGDGQLVTTLRGFQGPATSAVFGNHDRWIVATGADGSTRIWDVTTWRLLAVMHRHTRPINTLAFRSSDNAILTGGDDRTAKLYHCGTCMPLDRLRDLAGERQRHVRRLPGD